MKFILIYLFCNYIFLEVVNLVAYKDRPLYSQIWDELTLGTEWYRFFAIGFMLLFGWVIILGDLFNRR